MSDGLLYDLPDAPQLAGAPSPTAIPVAPQEIDRQNMEGLPDAPDAPALRDFTAWRASNAGVASERAANVLRLASSYSLPTKFVADHFEEVQAKAKSNELASRLTYAPTVEKFIAQDPVMGAAAQDDIGPLGWVERNITGKWERIPGARPWTGDPTQQMARPPDWILKMGLGVEQLEQGFDRTRIAMNKAAQHMGQPQTPEQADESKKLEQFGEQAEQENSEAILTTEKAIGPETLAHRIALAPFQMAPYLAGVAATSIAAGPAGAYAFNWSQAYGNDYENFRTMKRQDGVTPLLSDDEARSFANTTANLSAGLQTVLDVPMVKGLPLGEGIAQKITGQAVAEALGERGVRQLSREFIRGGVHLAAGSGLMATQAAADRAGQYAARVSHGEEDHASDIAREGLRGFVNAIPDFILMSGYAPTRALLEETGRQFNAPREAMRLKQITDSSREALLTRDNPGGKAEDLIGAMAANSDATTVYVTLDQWKKHWTGKGLDPAEVAARVMGDGGKGYSDADGSKADLAIPIERYVTQLAPNGHADALQEFVKLSQDGITPAEYKAQLDQAAKGLVAGSPEFDAFHEVFEDYRARAVAAGTPVREAEANAQFVARALTLWADKHGQGKTALDLYRDNPIRILGPRGQYLETAAPGVPVAPTSIAPGEKSSAESAPERKAAQPVVITPQMPKGEPVQYKVLESADLIPSHDPFGFGPNPAYPQGVQERNYLGQPEEQAKVVGGGFGLNPQLLLTDTPSALDGPPLVTGGKKALVLGGNGRSMMVQRAFQDAMQRERYRAELIRKAESFGLKAKDIEAMASPVLVRVVNGITSESSKEDLVAAVRRFNEGMTQQLSPRARAIAEARTLTPATMQSLGELLSGAGDKSLRDVMRDDPSQVIDILRRDGVVTDQNRAQWLSGGHLTDEAKDRIEGMFLGRVMENEQRMSATTPELLKKLERASPFLMRVAGTNPALDETSTVRAAVDLLNDANRRGLPLRDVVGQGDLFGGGPKTDPAVVSMAELLDKSGQRKIGDAFKAWAQHAAVDPSQRSLLGAGPSLGSAREELFSGKTPATDVRSAKLEYETLRAWQRTILEAHPDGKDLPAKDEARLKEISAKMAALQRIHGTTLDQAAWHVSPHRFEKFSMNAIGSGEGAQVYGHGLYFAENPEVAQHYRDTLSTQSVDVKGIDPVLQKYSDRRVLQHLNKAAEALADKGPDAVLREALKQAQASLADYKSRRANMFIPDERRAVRRLEELSAEEITLNRGALYKVDVPEGSRLLDYDKPLAEQSPRVRQALRDAGLWPEYKVSEGKGSSPVWLQTLVGGKELARETFRTEGGAQNAAAEREKAPTIKGEEIYNHLSQYELDHAAGASERLRKAGIPGLQYLDQGSRADAEGTHNFVIWDDKEIKTFETLYQGKPIADLDGATATLREDERGFVRIFTSQTGGRGYEINLKNPDRSTLAHETFHALSIIMGDVAQTAKDPALKADYEALLKSMGYASHEERQTALEPAKEERASHWWEQYLAEGKAPVPELAGVFNRFKTWLLKIYKGVQGVATQYRGAYGKDLPALSDEVRGIFDRMLASQEQIDAARGKIGGDAFTEELKKKLPEEARKAIEMGRVYTLTSQEQELAASMKSAKDAHGLMEKEQAKVRAEVASEANADPAQRAMHFLKTGEFKGLGGQLQPETSEALKMGDGSVPKLDRQMIVDRYGQEIADAMPRDILRHDGVNPDVLAPRFGFTSSMEMVHALASLPQDGAAAIEQEVRQRMAERYPTLLNDPQVMADAALNTAHDEKQATQIVKELRALAEHIDPSLKTKASAIDLKAIRAVAKRLIADKPVGQLAPDYYLKAERDAAQRAFEAMRKGDTAGAFGERSAQLLNMHLWREARDAKKLADSAVNYLRDQLDDAKRATLGKAGPEFRNGVDAVLSALRLEKNNQAVQPAPDPGAYDALAARIQDAQVEIDPNDAAALRSLLVQPKDWSRLTLDELQNVRDFVKVARTVARAQNEVNSFGKRMDLVQTVQQLSTESAAGNKDLGPQTDDQSQITRVQRLQAGVRAWDAAALRAETLWKMLGKMGGQIFDGYIDARNRKEKLASAILGDIESSFEKAGKDFKARIDEVLPLDKDLPQNGTDLGGPRSRRWLMMLALNMGNEGNIQRATEGRGWTVDQVKTAIGKYLSREELQFVQSRWDAMEPLGQLLAEKEERKTGLPLQRVVPLPLELTLADGSAMKLDGGYWPAKYDPRVSRSGLGAQQEAAGGIQAFYGDDYRRATTAKSHVKQRAQQYQNIVNLNWSVYPSHIAQVIHDIAFDEYVSDTAKVLNSDTTQFALRHSLGLDAAQELRTWLKVVATQQTGSAPAAAEKALGPVFSWLRSRVVMSSIVGSAPVLVSQVAHPLIAAAAGKLGALNAAASIPKALLPDVQQFALDNSHGEIAHRQQRAVAALNDRLREIGAPDKGLLSTASHIVEHGMHWVDTYVSTAVWTAAMNDAKGKGLADADAFKYADDKLREVMPTHETAEMPSLLRDKGLIGSLLMAHGFQNTLYNVARSTWHEKGPLEATGRILAMTAVSGLLGGLMLGHGKEDDETWGQWSLRKALAAPFELIPFVPNVTEPLIDHLVTGKTKKADVRNAPVLAGVQSLMEGYGKLASDSSTTEDKFWAAAELALFGAKLPARQISKTGRYLSNEFGSDLSNGRIGNIGSGIIYGPQATRRSATPFDAASDMAANLSR